MILLSPNVLCSKIANGLYQSLQLDVGDDDDDDRDKQVASGLLTCLGSSVLETAELAPAQFMKFLTAHCLCNQ